ncbi:MAG TPA: hypothetical protein VHT27_02730 [Solirubrobacteraceae bacterium]|jgi:hypothetical protein|nr:hypothetical protein [Solirubrobacteraceae bacterium]
MASTQATAQDRYVQMLMERIRQDRYPSHQLMERVEAAFWTPRQIEEYLDVLLEKADEAWYPSKQILDRIHRLLAYASQVAQ